MSGGDVDVEPYLDSRNTIGHGNHNSNSQSKMGQNCRKGSGKGYGGAMRKWWWYAEVYVGTGTKLDES